MRRQDFIDFYSDFSDDDPEYIREYLDSEGVDVDRFRERLSEEIRKRRAGLEPVKSGKLSSSFRALRELGAKLRWILSPEHEPHGAMAGFTKDKSSPPEDESPAPGADKNTPDKSAEDSSSADPGKE